MPSEQFIYRVIPVQAGVAVEELLLEGPAKILCFDLKGTQPGVGVGDRVQPIASFWLRKEGEGSHLLASSVPEHKNKRLRGSWELKEGQTLWGAVTTTGAGVPVLSLVSIRVAIEQS